MSQDQFWKALEKRWGTVTARQREVPLLKRLQQVFVASSDDAERDQALALALQVLEAAEAVADDKVEALVRLGHRPTPPEWWRARHRVMFERLRGLQSEALRLFGVDQPIPQEDVAGHVERLRQGVRACGKSATLAYPVDFSFSGGSTIVVDTTFTVSAVTAGTTTVIDAATTGFVPVDAATTTLAVLPFDAAGVTLPLARIGEEVVWSGIDDADRSHPPEQVLPISSTIVSAAADYEEFWLRSLQGSPLYRVALMESAVVSRTFGCNLHEAGLFLLCDIVPEAHWIQVTEDLSDFQVAWGMRAAPVHIAVPSGEVPVSEVAAAYAAHIGMFSPEGRPRTSPKSEWPSRVVAFVLQYRREHGGRAHMDEIYEAWKDENPDCPVYPTLQSFRVTFNRVNKRERSA